MNAMKKCLALVAVAAASTGAIAAGPDMTTLTAAVDFSTVTTAVLGAAASLILVYLAVKGARLLIGMIRGG